jgi:hypothetical protein
MRIIEQTIKDRIAGFQFSYLLGFAYIPCGEFSPSHISGLLA